MSELIRRQDAIDVLARQYRYESDRMTALQEIPVINELECIDAVEMCKIKIALDKLKEYQCMEEKGLLIKIPVSIGSDVYFIPSKVNYDLNVLSKHEENNRVYHQKVAQIVFTARGWYLECDKNLEYGVDHILVDKFYQETWFSSEGEAALALRKMGE